MTTARISILSLAAMAALIAPAAADGITQSGQVCTAQTHSDSEYFYYYIAGARLPFGSKTRRLHCPLRLRNETAAGKSRDITWARATVEDRTSTSGVRCWVHATSLAGGSYYSGARSTSTSYQGIAVLSWWTYVLNGGAMLPPLAEADIGCDVPPPQSGSSSVLSVAIGE